MNAEIKSTANSQLRFATGPSSTDRVTIDSGGNVGIGTPNPAGPLHILGPAGAPPAAPPALQNGLLLGVQSTTSYKWMQSYGGALALNPIGNNVGIGTSQPLANLDIQSNNNVCLACNNSGDFTTGVFTNFTPNNQPTLLAINLSGGLALETVSSDNGWAARFDASTALANGVLITAPQGRPGLLVASGTKSAAVATSQGACTLYTEESAEVWFTDYGFGHLQEGRTVIRIDPLFSETVNLNEPYHVFIQAYGKATLYVNQRTPSCG